MKVKTAMAKDPITIGPEASVGTALEAMRTNRIRHLPVVDETGLLVGSSPIATCGTPRWLPRSKSSCRDGRSVMDARSLGPSRTCACGMS